jgi:hypothetical protein
VRLLLLLALAFQASGAVTLIAHTGIGGRSPVTTGAINTTGASLLVVTLNGYGTVDPATATVSDSKGNTWIACTSQTRSPSGSVTNTVIFYAWAPTVGASHTVTVNVNDYLGVTFTAFAGIRTSSNPLGATQNGALITATAVTTMSAGSVTPSQAGTLVFANLGTGDGTSTFTIGGGFTVIDQVPWVSGTNESNASAYLVQGVASAVNPVWNWSTANVATATIAYFIPAPSASGSQVFIF